MKRRIAVTTLIVALLVLSVFLGNHLYVGRPIEQTLAEDVRNDGISLRAHLLYWCVPTELVLDLREVRTDKSPLDLWRVLMQAASTLEEHGREFETVVVARAGRPVFIMTGSDFKSLGSSYRYGENPVYLLRTFPEKLYHPDGTSAYGSWTGGLLGVVGQQMEDLNDAALAWITGATN